MLRPVLLLICVLSLAGCSKKDEQKKPNIIFIIGDDISWDDLGCYGNKSIHTPNIDRLASEGMRFTNMYLTSSSCSPSRTSILTGRYPHNTGAAELHTPLPGHLAFFPELLKNKGYYTALVGKWHEGPLTRRAYDSLLVDPKVNGEGAENQWISLLRSRPADKPFFFWLAPLDAHRPWSEKVEQGHLHNPSSEISVPATLADTKETRADLANYYNEISRLDFFVGELEKELTKQGIADNTLIIFMADNGRPFPGSKTRLYERGIKAPFIVKFPQQIDGGQVCESLISSIDIAPTLLEVGSANSAATIQGKSFAGLFQKPKGEFRKYVFAEHNWHDYEAYERAVVTRQNLYLINRRTQLDNGGPIDANQSPSAKSLNEAITHGTITAYQKEIFLMPRPSEEFYDSVKDPLQAQNQIGNPAYAEPIALLKKVLKQWQDETGDTEPKQLTPDWYDRKTGTQLAAKGTRGEMPGTASQAEKNNNKGPF